MRHRADGVEPKPAGFVEVPSRLCVQVAFVLEVADVAACVLEGFAEAVTRHLSGGALFRRDHDAIVIMDD